MTHHQINHRTPQTKISFGTTSAVITNLGLIAGLSGMEQSKTIIIAGILIVALADNISDSAGIHIFQESEFVSNRENWISTITNFFVRLVVSLTFLVLILVFPFKMAIGVSMVWGLVLLAVLSYKIAKAKNVNPINAIVEHVGIAAVVIILSTVVRYYISSKF
ncbi:MAG: hypothetical protein HQL26_06490 [Candidatus Omnitrophica bacterium]|nr:hypothetical protein [Candidatus Omnitrophota bacterium]